MTMTYLQKNFTDILNGRWKWDLMSEKKIPSKEKKWFEEHDGHFNFCEEHILNTYLRILFWFLKMIREKCFTSLQTFNKYHILIRYLLNL